MIPVRHGMAKPRTRAYIAWLGITQRVTNPKNKLYPGYGGRGIDIDPRWRDFINFYSDMGECPPELQIERIDNDKGYWPWNCRWANRTDQQNNRRTTIYLTINGATLPLREWARKTGLPFYALEYRHKMNWPEVEMLSPLDRKRRVIPYKRRVSC